MKIQFPVKASIHDHYRRIYIRITKAAWIAYQLEQLVGKLVRVTIWKAGGEKPMNVPMISTAKLLMWAPKDGSMKAKITMARLVKNANL